MQGNLKIERMCQLARVSRAGFYRSLREQEPGQEDLEVRSRIQQIDGSSSTTQTRNPLPFMEPRDLPGRRVLLPWPNPRFTEI